MGQATHLFAFSLNPTHTTNKQRQHTSSPSPQEKLNTTLLCDILNTFKYLNIWCERTYLQLCIIWCFALSLFLSLRQTSLLVSSSNCCFDLLLKNQYLSNSTKISTNTETAQCVYLDLPNSSGRSLFKCLSFAKPALLRSCLGVFYVQFFSFLQWASPKKLKYGKLRLGETVLMQTVLDTPDLTYINLSVLLEEGPVKQKTPCIYKHYR